MSDNHSKEQRSYNMSRIKSTDSSPELAVRKYLFGRGLRYRKNDKRFPGRPDLVFPKYRVIIFINGCFWHMHKNCPSFVMPKSNLDYWTEKLRNNKIRDQLNIQKLEEMGWHVITVWECELKKDVQKVTLEKLYDSIVAQNFVGQP